MKRTRCLLAICLTALTIFAQKEATGVGRYTYYVPEGVSIETAKLTALDRAKIAAIENAFGSSISQSTTMITTNSASESSVDFLSLGESMVRGEWIQTIGKPAYDIRYVNNELIVAVEVKGKMREISDSKIDLKVMPLCNGVTKRHNRTDFRNGDDLYLSFSSPVDGYVAVFLVDYTTKKIYRMLPYRNEANTARAVSADKEYIFFSQKHEVADKQKYVDEYVLTTSLPSERNDLIVLFSPHSFAGGRVTNGNATGMPVSQDWEEFHRWLASVRRSNPGMQLHREIIMIHNNKQ